MSEAIRKITGWLMMLLGVLMLTGALADSRAGGWLRTAPPPLTQADLTGVRQVSVRMDKGQVRVTAEDRPDLAVTAEALDVKLLRQGAELQVRIAAPWWRWPRFFEEPSAVTVRLPKSFAETLSLDLRTGKVEIQDLRLGQLNLQLVTGKVDITHFTGAMRAKITTGSLDAQFDGLTGPVAVDQATGRQVLALPAEADFTVDARAGRGRVRNELPRAGAGTHAVILRVGTGEITVR